MSAVALKPDRKALGAYYTPRSLAQWLAEEVVGALDPVMPIVALDPACGDGQLLESLGRAAPGRGVQLLGLDIDGQAVVDARRRLPATSMVLERDALETDIESAFARRPNVVIANPPWGAALPRGRSEYRGAFAVAHGQFDTFDLFVELAVRALLPGGVLGLVLPDAILLPEHEKTRRFLLTATSLLSLVRLGEGLFDGVFRGALLLVARKGTPDIAATVRCARVHFADRTRVIREVVRLHDVLRFHEVAQARFTSNPHAEFDLDVAADEQPFRLMRERSGFQWDSTVQWARGIEIGKDGRVARCTDCGAARPLPKSADARCPKCGAGMRLGAEAIVRALSGAPKIGWAPLIVGSDVQRYSVTPSRQVLLGVQGIHYKMNGLDQRKLVVRKTGIGIQAALDESGSQTVQSVFHCVPSESAPSHTIDFLLGVLNSRLIQAYHLRATGDHEWRSHPYVTPRTLRSLPIPSIDDNPAQARRIAKLALRMNRRWDPRVDQRLDEEVADLFGVGRLGIEWSREVLEESQQLRPIARLLEPRQLLRD